jgi:Methyltransferase domain
MVLTSVKISGDLMIPARQVVGRILRDSGLLNTADKLRYFATIAGLQRGNRRFVAANPGFRLPPKALAFAAYSAPDWAGYKRSGLETAAFLLEISRKYVVAFPEINVFEWGCGADAQIYGSDYNEATIAWCRDTIPRVTFVHNALLPDPPLPFERDFFDFIYSISVFTHLSESTSHVTENCWLWFASHTAANSGWPTA